MGIPDSLDCIFVTIAELAKLGWLAKYHCVSAEVAVRLQAFQDNHRGRYFEPNSRRIVDSFLLFRARQPDAVAAQTPKLTGIN